MKTKIYAIIGKHGTKKAAELIGVSPPTLKKRLENTDDFRQSEVETIERLYEQI
jgi:DNA-binding transcriptional regulator YdaS (Cro superfamily)